jgi:hypothetical protein
LENLKLKKNNLTFGFFNFCNYYLNCFINKEEEKLNLLEKLEKRSEKIQDKFDIFYYLKKLKSFKYIKKIFIGERTNAYP